MRSAFLEIFSGLIERRYIVNIFIPYNKKYILRTYDLDGHHAAFIEDTVLRNLIKRLIKNKLVDRVDVYTQEENTLDGILSKCSKRIVV